MTDDMERIIRETALRVATEESERIEADLIRALGWRIHLPHSIIRRMGYEVVYQLAPNGAILINYRGIRRRSMWIIDHYPDWPWCPYPGEEMSK